MRNQVRAFPKGIRVVLVLAIVALAGFLPGFYGPTAAYAQGTCGPLDFVFIIDTTASMGTAIGEVSDELSDILGQIQTASGGDYQLGLVTFKDDVTVDVNLAAGNDAAIQTAIAGLTVSGGANWPEASDEALNTAVNRLPAAGRPQTGDFTGVWRPNATKVIVLITDAEPAGFDDAYTEGVDDVHAHQVAEQARAMGILISAVYVPTLEGAEGGTSGSQSASGPLQNPDVIERVMRDYAATTGGLYTETAPTGEGTAEAIRGIIGRCGGGVPPTPTTGVPTVTPVPPTPAPTPIPEPTTVLLFGGGAAALGAYLRRRREAARNEQGDVSKD